jgi:predicted DNA-binding transcriptional regulator YafY
VKRDRYQAASRLVDLLEHVDAGKPLRLPDICERFQVDEACARSYRDWIAARRDLVEEREAGFKVWRKRPAGEDASPAALARAAALSFAVDALTELDGTAHLDELRAMADQARLSLPEGVRHKLARVTRTFRARHAGRSLNPDRRAWVAALIQAIQDRRVCGLDYEKQDGVRQHYTVEPWGMLLNNGRLLLVAGKRRSRQPTRRRIFDIDGILGLEVRGERFVEPADHQVAYDDVFRDSIGIYCDWPTPARDVVLRVGGGHAVALRHRAVHVSQQHQDLADGRIEVRLRVVLCPDLVSFVLAMMPHVEVVEPQDLRDQVAQHLAGVATR